MFFEGKKFWDAMKSMARSLGREIVSIIMYKKLAEPIAYGIMGLPLPGSSLGGEAGGSNLSGEFPTTAHGLPYIPELQHGGEVLKTGVAVVHKGETFSGQGGGMQPPSVIINNNTGISMQQEGAPRFDGENWVVNIVTKAIDTDISFRRKIGAVRG